MREANILLITGGSRGIGATTARLAAAQGWFIVVNHRRSPAAAGEVCRTIELNGGNAIAMQADISVESEVVSLFSRMRFTFGSGFGLYCAPISNLPISVMTYFGSRIFCNARNGIGENPHCFPTVTENG